MTAEPSDALVFFGATGDLAGGFAGRGGVGHER